MSIITALIILFSGPPVLEEHINMPAMYIVAKPLEKTPWEVALETLRIIRQYTPHPLDIKIVYEID